MMCNVNHTSYEFEPGPLYRVYMRGVDLHCLKNSGIPDSGAKRWAIGFVTVMRMATRYHTSGGMRPEERIVMMIQGSCVCV